MKQVTDQQILEAFDRALAAAAKIAARRREETALRENRYKGAAESPAKYESDKH